MSEPGAARRMAGHTKMNRERGGTNEEELRWKEEEERERAEGKKRGRNRDPRQIGRKGRRESRGRVHMS